MRTMRTYKGGWWKSEFIITHTSCMVVLCWNIRPIVLNFCSGFKIQIYGLWTNHWNNGCIHRYQNIYSKKVLILMESTDFETTRNAMSWFVYIFFSMRKNVSRPKYVMSKLIQRNIPTLIFINRILMVVHYSFSIIFQCFYFIFKNSKTTKIKMYV